MKEKEKRRNDCEGGRNGRQKDTVTTLAKGSEKMELERETSTFALNRFIAI